MYVVNDDMSIYVTRGDMLPLAVSLDNNGVNYVFQPGEVVRFRVFEKKGCHCVALQKDFVLTEAVESVDIWLTKEETKIGDVISKPKDYWYEIELNPDSNPQTIVGYDDDGPKVFRLFPEGADTGEGADGPLVDFIPGIDEELDAESTKPVQNKAIAGAINDLRGRVHTLEQYGSKITVDDALDGNSTNPVQNKVVTAKINEAGGQAYAALTGMYQHEDRLTAVEADVADLKENGVSITVDTQLGNSPNPIANSAVALAIGDLEDGFTRIDGRVDDLNDRLDNFRPDGTGGGIIVDDALSTTSTNPVQNKAVTSEINSLVVEDGFTLEYRVGGVVNNNGVAIFDKSATMWECVVLDVSEHTGAILGVKTYINKGHPIFVADSEFNIKATYEPNTAYPNNANLQTDISITIPDGATWVIIPHYVGKPDVEVTGYMVDKYIRRDAVVQEQGDSETAVMSQKAVTEFCTEVAEQVAEGATAELDERVTTLEQNGGLVEDGFTLEYSVGAVVNNNGVAVFDKSTTVWEYVVLDVSKHTGATLGVKTFINEGHPIFVADSEFNIKATYDPNTAYPNNTSLQTDISITIPEDASWLIINHWVGKPDVEVTGYMVDKYIRRDALVQEQGDSETAVMSQKIVTKALNTHDEAIAKMAYSFRKVDAVCDNYSCETAEVATPTEDSTTGLYDLNYVYGMYDALVAEYPEYVTKKLLGTVLPDTEALPIYRYDFTPLLPLDNNPKTSGLERLFKILYCSGTHGGETSPILVGVRFFQDLCANWRNQDLLRALRFNCQFTVIPIVNPYGYVHDTRQNENQVDLNRNFTNNGDWHNRNNDVVGDTNYPGPYAGSEISTQLIEGMTAEESFDFIIDHHTYAPMTTDGKAGYFVVNNARNGDAPFANMFSLWCNGKVVANNTEITDLTKSYWQSMMTGGTCGGYVFGCVPNGFCFENMTRWGTAEMEAAYPSQKFNVETIGALFHTAFVSFHSY